MPRDVHSSEPNMGENGFLAGHHLALGVQTLPEAAASPAA